MSNSIKMKRPVVLPDGTNETQIVVLPAANREYYEAKGFDYVGPAADPGTSDADEEARIARQAAQEKAAADERERIVRIVQREQAAAAAEEKPASSKKP